ncbi:MAG: helix-turn-helix transcriptional regulator [Clostridium sp.]|uniref:helix-turn-helix domain-containing protein n=1 Tax=Clostridium sp. TaxID=1506 RepID=UPI0029031CB0|nr:helix-turn-helix transcriptional regulator [Clostridium sp.]MDU1604728.1 helix-turn-helix transcriptional regulator [Clostridium sp.]
MDMLGIKIKSARESKNMSICELANKSGLSDSYLSRLENGQRKDPSISTVIKIVTALEISIDDFIKL